MFYIWELANNHGGSVEHAFDIIDAYALLRDKHQINAGIKLQLRDIPTFIHPAYRDYAGNKHIARFRSTALAPEQFGQIIERARSLGFTTVATPFDERSIDLTRKLDIDVLKVASCSVDDWSLIRTIALENKLIIVSTAGASSETLEKVNRILVKENGRDVAYMHCIGEYPTPQEHSNLAHIDELMRMFPKSRVGISSHESPLVESVVPYAVAKGCTIIEKHVDVLGGPTKMNAYSCTPDDFDRVIEKTKLAQSIVNGKPDAVSEATQLHQLKRGIYSSYRISKGDAIFEADVYLAMPCQPGQLDASRYDDLMGITSSIDIETSRPVTVDVMSDALREKKIASIVEQVVAILNAAKVRFNPKEDLELSVHNGIDSYGSVGAAIINRINREYCKKIIVMLSGQSHPAHSHNVKEETFELLWGDCTLNLGGKTIPMHSMSNPLVLIERGAVHSFSSVKGCVLEEVSTTHVPGDSIYEDPRICKLLLSERKIMTKLGFAVV